MSSDDLPVYWPPRKRHKDAERFSHEAWSFWDSFYKQHKAAFFKDRHYLVRECPELLHGRKVILEVGCGVGNTVFPVLARNPDAFVHACDFSPAAISCLKQHSDYSPEKVDAFVCDFSKDRLEKHISPGSVDICTMIFVLSAIAPEKMSQALQNIAGVLRPGGKVFLRDYAAGDLAETLLSNGTSNKKIDEQFYVRGDGTCSYYFTEDGLEKLFAASGLRKDSMFVHEREVENHATQSKMQRRWIQASFTLQNHNETGPVNRGESNKPVEMTARNGEWDESEQLNEVEDGIGSLFEPEGAHDEVEETYRLGGCGDIRVRSVSRESRHTLAHTGLMVRDSAYCFADFLEKQPSLLSGKQVLELGSGSSPLCTLACLRHASKVVATDGSSQALNMMARNLSLNASKVVIERARLRELSGGDREQCERVLAENPNGFDVIIGADVVYVEKFVPLLFETARRLLSKVPEALLLLCHGTRRVSEGDICDHARRANFAQTSLGCIAEAVELPAAVRLLVFKQA